ncbi:MAG: high-affinity iron transporter [Actinomycetota bacterium]|nr:high-affinity iron transporter [Actinomycetota bacterium]
MRFRRVLFLSVLVGVLLVGTAQAAFAAQKSPSGDVSTEEAVHELDIARRLVDESVQIYEDGDTKAAYEAARNSYLDHFEYVEIPLRVRDEGLTLAVEEDYATLRNLIEAGAPVNDVEATAAEVHRGLDDVERTLTEPGLAAPIIALTYAFTILFREGLEAVLVVAAVLGYLEASRNTQYRKPVLRGVAGAVVATILLFALTTLFVRLAPLQRELLEAGTALLAVVVLFYVSFWLVTRLEHRRWMEFVKAKVWTAATTGSTLALAGVGFTAVFREGFETVLLYQALLTFSQGLEAYVAIGTALGLVGLGIVGWIIFKAGRRIPIKAFLTTAVALVMVVSVAFAGNAVRGFQEAALLPVTYLESLPKLPIFVSHLTGWYPTRETLLAQGILAAIYLLGAVWTFIVLPRREKAGHVTVDVTEAPHEEREEASV